MSNKQIKSGIIEFCEMANMPEMGLEIFNAGGGWRDQKWAPSWSVKLPSLRQGRVQTLPCSLGRQSARSSSLERGKPRLSALKRRVRLSCFTCLRCAGSLVLFPAPRGGEIVRFVCPTETNRAVISVRAMSYSNFFHLTLNKIEECNPHDYSSSSQEARKALLHNTIFNFKSSSQEARKALLLSTIFNFKCYINIAITRTCIRQPFTISYMLKFICMLIASKQICSSHVMERSVGKEIYISLTEEERQYHIMVGKVLQHRNNIMRIRALIPRFRSV
ncbi:hypothetical protein T03_7777 [Trichinella britovi]|uniref:Uncharacterized protein n=5 Tax=Trichinella TaxID=6333 RepID=A0A0V1C6V7_TRIBR|nr:hypothetical protein T03_7777 [Trichinella britovi]